MIDLNGTPDTYIAGMLDAARIIRERKGKYTSEQTANYLEALCTSLSSPSDPPQTAIKHETDGWAFSQGVGGIKEHD